MSRYRRPNKNHEGTPMFYNFFQNNSGGVFDIDDETGIGPEVYIEATSPEHANQIAESMGIYFDGVDNGQDCSCCGDRWYRTSKYDAKADVNIDNYFRSSWHNTVYVHRLNGTLERIRIDENR